VALRIMTAFAIDRAEYYRSRGDSSMAPEWPRKDVDRAISKRRT
jgi:hypothetical protein